ncbi:putative bifunctional diguanylate cyclase/phosphodiesterase [Reinekea sp.]|jgi:EAL domain-containing protein (putative c-di-GMP-specific phosphodiesterase class I)/GGDEF domain-containing protein|uniref:putative bifunctional diguanylate cyclase/phosphodiesterase n=1 Tax=Reinekea sp. TaxID=1970455 RepID=UPI002A8355F8|nr:EAL domain-containing protein [Reinekea sp.]
MNARRSLFVMVALAIMFLVISLTLAARLQGVIRITNDLIHTYSALDRWVQLTDATPQDLPALNEQRRIILAHIPAALGVDLLPSEPLTRFLRQNTVPTEQAGALVLKNLLIWELFECHRLQNIYSFRVNLTQVALTLLVLAIGVVSYFMGRRAQDYRLAPFPEANPNPVFGLNYQGEIIYQNAAVGQVLQRLVGGAGEPTNLLPIDYRQRLAALRHTKVRQQVWVHSLGEHIFAHRVQLLPQSDRIHVYSEDITEQEEIRARNAFMAFHDPVCLLANRQRLEQIIDAMDDPKRSLTLVMTYVTGLDKVLSTQGLPVLDHLARELSIRLRGAYQSVLEAEAERPVVFRFDANLFGCVYIGELRAHQHQSLAAALAATVEQPYKRKDREFYLGVQSGSASEPSSISARQLIQKANLALHAIDGKVANYQLFDQVIEADIQAGYQIEHALRHAIERDELTMVYQPQQDLRTGALIGFEALMRWHRAGTLISPVVFIPIAEKTGVIHSIGHWALRDVLQQSIAWQQMAGVSPGVLAVNVSAQEFGRSDFIEDIERALIDCLARPEWIQLEITESLLIEGEDLAIARMHQLKKLGFTLAIDDFGTGYSSFSYLSRFPVDKLKIDRSFIVNMANGVRDEAVVAAMIDVAHQLGIKVIAEGVETEQERVKLIALGCDQLQGYLYGRPLSVADAAIFALNQQEVL